MYLLKKVMYFFCTTTKVCIIFTTKRDCRMTDMHTCIPVKLFTDLSLDGSLVLQ